MKQNVSEPMKLYAFGELLRVVRNAEIHVLVPLDHLLEGVVVPVVAREPVRVHEATERVTTLYAW